MHRGYIVGLELTVLPTVALMFAMIETGCGPADKVRNQSTTSSEHPTPTSEKKSLLSDTELFHQNEQEFPKAETDIEGELADPAFANYKPSVEALLKDVEFFKHRTEKSLLPLVSQPIQQLPQNAYFQFYTYSSALITLKTAAYLLSVLPTSSSKQLAKNTDEFRQSFRQKSERLLSLITAYIASEPDIHRRYDADPSTLQEIYAEAQRLYGVSLAFTDSNDVVNAYLSQLHASFLYQVIENDLYYYDKEVFNRSRPGLP